MKRSILSSAFFDHFPKFIEDLISIDQLAAICLTGAPFQFCLELTKGFIAFLLLAFQEPQSFANDFARGLVTAGLDAALQETIEFRSDRDVDSGSVSRHIR